MENKNILYEALKDVTIEEIKDGIKIRLDDNDLVIEGSKAELIELANMIVDTALSEYDDDHIHIDENILVSKDSEIKELIIEKKSK